MAKERNNKYRKVTNRFNLLLSERDNAIADIEEYLKGCKGGAIENKQCEYGFPCYLDEDNRLVFIYKLELFLIDYEPIVLLYWSNSYKTPHNLNELDDRDLFMLSDMLNRMAERKAFKNVIFNTEKNKEKSKITN